MNKKLICAMLAMTLLLGGCNLLGVSEDDIWVVTSTTQIQEDCRDGAVPIDIVGVTPELQEKFPNEKFVVSQKRCLIDGAVFAPISTNKSDWSDGVIGNLIDVIFEGAQAFFPWLAGLEGLFLLLFPRKRKHYATAAKSLVTGNVKETLMSLGKALGAAHSSVATKETFEDEVAEKAAVKKVGRKKKNPS